jgi:hypothetical protein
MDLLRACAGVSAEPSGSRLQGAVAQIGLTTPNGQNAEYNKMWSTTDGCTLDVAFRGFYSAFS